MTELHEGSAETDDLSAQPWRDIPREEARWMRPHLPDLVETMVEGVLRNVPEYGRPDDPVYTEVIRDAVAQGMGHFVQMIADPDTPWREVHQLFFDIGYGEAVEGRSLEHLQNALRVASRTAWRYLSREADRLKKPRELAIALTEVNFAYLDLLASAAAQGYARAREKAAGEREQRRARLLGLLLSAPPAPHDVIVEQAGLAGWPLPERIAMIVLEPRPGTGGEGPAGLPPFLLSGVDRGRPCLVMPDPDRPGGPDRLTATIAGWTGAIGPSVPLEQAGVSLHWAHRTLDLMAAGRLGGAENPAGSPDRPSGRHKRGGAAAGRLVRADRHLPELLLQEGWTLAEATARRRLAPLTELGPHRGGRLAMTMLECLKHGFNATDAAEALCVHPQTVRYRLAQLHDLFDYDIEDPALRLELMLLLPVWLRDAADGEQ
ncbi:helix-turn-helix domain-containing protein [Actinomadura opuntiae]|uniref:helix-turn-helix domain-containing protein n=1 Tax=Actinomadura sp. OS1-43 TaxID=604315 RepID=UPI00255A8A92|nr:helix-turn-helix domain-containing protein [Actinomadura sp. OS1-43]MDL4819356.1 helix-turn-helix domain-containing protein [Actinomadura sp. OS1-43]